jgi:hypothetical protein
MIALTPQSLRRAKFEVARGEFFQKSGKTNAPTIAVDPKASLPDSPTQSMASRARFAKCVRGASVPRGVLSTRLDRIGPLSTQSGSQRAAGRLAGSAAEIGDIYN